MRFTDSYGEQSCTAGRSSFITGQSVFRTGLSKVGMPGAPVGLSADDPTIAELLKPLGYATGQFGKNHLGDRNEHLPTVHGFDEFFGNLYHLNAEEEPESPNWPSPEEFPTFNEMFRPRGVIHSFATEADDPTEEGRYGRVGRQRIEDTGPLTKKRMESIDDEIVERAAGFIRQQHAAGTPFFVWVNTTHMHFRTHPKPESIGQSGRWQSTYHDAMIDHDRNVGTVLDVIDELGIAEDTIVIYSRQRPAHEHLAGWRDDPLPEREEHQLGGCVPYPRDDPLARAHPGRRRLQRDHPAPRLASDTPVSGGRAGHHGQAQVGVRDRGQDLQGPHRRLRLPAVPHRDGGQGTPTGAHLLLG
jgi:arylsulfatase A-like enzyme